MVAGRLSESFHLDSSGRNDQVGVISLLIASERFSEQMIGTSGAIGLFLVRHTVLRAG